MFLFTCYIYYIVSQICIKVNTMSYYWQLNLSICLLISVIPFQKYFLLIKKIYLKRVCAGLHLQSQHLERWGREIGMRLGPACLGCRARPCLTKKCFLKYGKKMNMLNLSVTNTKTDCGRWRRQETSGAELRQMEDSENHGSIHQQELVIPKYY